LREEGTPEGTVRQYKSEWNTHVPAAGEAPGYDFANTCFGSDRRRRVGHRPGNGDGARQDDPPLRRPVCVHRATRSSPSHDVDGG
jgi:hypothetical protein